MGNERKKTLKRVKRPDLERNKQNCTGMNAEQPRQSYMEYREGNKETQTSEELTINVCGCDVECNWPLMEASVVC